MSITSRITTITPQEAEKLLKLNTGNFRPLDRSRVRQYAADMASGRWILNGEAIKRNGRELLDGQHRLAAIVLSGASIETLIVEGLSSESAISMDKGKPRSVASWIRHCGIANATQISAIGRHSLYYERGLWGQIAVIEGATDSEVISFVETNQDRLQSALKIARPASRFINPSLLGAIMYHAAVNNLAEKMELCIWFCDSLARGEHLSETDAVFHLRRKMETHAQRKASPYVQKGLATLAWNKTALGEECRHLQFRLTGPSPSHIQSEILPCPSWE